MALQKWGLIPKVLFPLLLRKEFKIEILLEIQMIYIFEQARSQGGPGGQGPPGLEKFTSVPPLQKWILYIHIHMYIYIYVLYILAVPPLRIQAGYGPVFEWYLWSLNSLTSKVSSEGGELRSLQIAAKGAKYFGTPLNTTDHAVSTKIHW